MVVAMNDWTIFAVAWIVVGAIVVCLVNLFFGGKLAGDGPTQTGVAILIWPAHLALMVCIVFYEIATWIARKVFGKS
jgi:hypothetical protein